MKKIVSTLLALVLLAAVAAPAFATTSIDVTSPEGWVAEVHDDYSDEEEALLRQYFANQGITDYFIIGGVNIYDPNAGSEFVPWPADGVNISIFSTEFQELGYSEGDTVVLANVHDGAIVAYTGSVDASGRVIVNGLTGASPFAMGIKRAEPVDTPIDTPTDTSTPTPAAPATTSAATGESALFWALAIVFGGALLAFGLIKVRRTNK